MCIQSDVAFSASCSAALVAPPEVMPDDWTVGLQAVDSTDPGALPLTSKLCSPSAPCTVLIDTGNPGISVPPTAFKEIQLATGAIVDQVTGFLVYPTCAAALASTQPSFTFRIADHVYTLAPKDYIQQVSKTPEAYLHVINLDCLSSIL